MSISDLDKVIAIVNQCGKRATEKGGDWYGRTSPKAEGVMQSKARFFLENHDAERLEFLMLLKRSGFTDAGYRAPYAWKVRFGEVFVEYVEGDVYVRRICEICHGDCGPENHGKEECPERAHVT